MNEPTHHTVIVDDLTSDQMGYVLAHFDRGIAALEAKVESQMEAAVVRALEQHTGRIAAKDSDYGKPVSTRVADHIADHWWSKVSKRIAFAVGILLFGWAAAWLGSKGIEIKGINK